MLFGYRGYNRKAMVECFTFLLIAGTVEMLLFTLRWLIKVFGF